MSDSGGPFFCLLRTRLLYLTLTRLIRLGYADMRRLCDGGGGGAVVGPEVERRESKRHRHQHQPESIIMIMSKVSPIDPPPLVLPDELFLFRPKPLP